MHNTSHRPLSIELSSQLNQKPTIASVIRSPESRLLSNIKFCLNNNGHDPKSNYQSVKKEILENHEMYDNPLFNAFFTEVSLDNIDSYFEEDINLICPLSDTNSIKYLQSQMLSGLKLPNVMSPTAAHQTEFESNLENEAIAHELYQLSENMGHLDKDKIAFNTLTKNYKPNELPEGIIHPLTLCFDNNLQIIDTVPTESLFAEQT